MLDKLLEALRVAGVYIDRVALTKTNALLLTELLKRKGISLDAESCSCLTIVCYSFLALVTLISTSVS